MWITKNVDLPDRLLQAQESSRLVVFAGAGVSIAPPSNLPSFRQLATLVSAGALDPENNEPIDRFLGRLAAQGVDVHCRTRDIIGNPESKPTVLHRDILSLFRSANAARVVTTNFDRHFSTAVRELSQGTVDTYYAPALPLGRDFTGIVYLHGSVDRAPHFLALTDSDFGRAYLTDGWATRFLQAMFAEYTVLFVGYSHDDPVMRYLARGLMPGTLRFALTKPGEDEHWRFLGISPVTYPLASTPDEHRALGQAIAAWARLGSMGALDHARRIRDIAESSPPLEPDSADYIESALRTRTTARFFTRYARTIEWLHWAEARSLLRPLFQVHEPVNPAARELATWFAECFVCKFPAQALAVVQRHGQHLNPVLWQAIAFELARQEPRPDAEVLGTWIEILLDCRPPDWSMDALGWSLASCRYPEDCQTALLLFEHLTRPHTRLGPHLRTPTDDGDGLRQIDVEIAIEGDWFELREAWRKVFRPNLASLCGALVPILTHHLTRAHRLLRAIGRANDRQDLPSMGRSAIEPHEQDDRPDALDILIDAARDVIETLVAHDPGPARAVIEAWSRSGVPLLRRLAVHGITESPWLTPDRKIAWVLAKGLLYVPGLKHEAFRLLAATYAKATEATRKRVLTRAERGPFGEPAENLSARTRQYETYNLLVWLHQMAPDCLLTAQHFDAAQERHPQFAPRQHPDFDMWMEAGWEKPHSPLAARELLEKDPRDLVGWLLSYQGDGPIGPNREGLLAELIGAVAACFEWGRSLAAALVEMAQWEADLWGSVLDGWRNAVLDDGQWAGIFPLLAAGAQARRLAEPIADLLVHGVGKEKGAIPMSCLPTAECIAAQLLATCAEDTPPRVQWATDWFTIAINDPGGKIAQFYIQALSRTVSGDTERSGELPADYCRYFDAYLSAGSYPAQMGCVVLASRIHFLFAVDADWTRRNILPLLDWTKDQERAERAWHGYLAWGRWNRALLPELLPLYQQVFPALAHQPPHLRERFCGHLASIATYGLGHPVSDGWLWTFLRQADPETRATWAGSMAEQLASLKQEAVPDLWTRWLDEYWSLRNSGVPVPLSEEEKQAMVSWAVPLKPVFPAVVDRICALDAPELGHTRFYSDLYEGQLAALHPAPLARLLKHLATAAREPFYHCHELQRLVQQLAGCLPPPAEMLTICHELARLGCRDAGELRDAVDRGNV